MVASATIGAAASRAGVHVETIRFYERKQLIPRPPKPCQGGYRLYPESTISRIRFIKQAQQLGFSLKEIAGLLDLRETPRSDAGQIQRWASDKLNEVEQKIVGLQRMRQELATLIAACPGQGELCQCSILQELETPANPASKKAIQPTQRSGTMKTITLNVDGMHCGGCEQVIRHLLESEPGVTGCTASHKAHQARIAYDPQQVSSQRLIEIIQGAGYTASALEPS